MHFIAFLIIVGALGSATVKWLDEKRRHKRWAGEFGQRPEPNYQNRAAAILSLIGVVLLLATIFGLMDPPR